MSTRPGREKEEERSANNLLKICCDASDSKEDDVNLKPREAVTEHRGLQALKLFEY